MPAPVYVPARDRGFLRVSGPDAVTFLQGLVSVDVTRATPEHALYGAMLNAQGRLVRDFFLTADDGALLLESAADGLDAFRRKLSIYRLRSKVEIDDVSDRWTTVLLPGETGREAAGLPADPGSARDWLGGVAYVDPRHAALGARAVLPAGDAAARLESAGLEIGRDDEYARHRLALGVPEGPDDLPAEQALPMEVGFDELNALDWQKGCYMGQELTARMRYRALVKKRLFPVRIEGPAPAPGTAVTVDGAEAGEMRSSAGNRGLAYLRLDAVDKARNGTLMQAGDARLFPERPDWMVLHQRPEPPRT